MSRQVIRINLAADYSADPLWDIDTGGMIGIDNLPVRACYAL